jgi:hypothetical protein
MIWVCWKSWKHSCKSKLHCFWHEVLIKKMYISSACPSCTAIWLNWVTKNLRCCFCAVLSWKMEFRDVQGKMDVQQIFPWCSFFCYGFCISCDAALCATHGWGPEVGMRLLTRSITRALFQLNCHGWGWKLVWGLCGVHLCHVGRYPSKQFVCILACKKEA